MPHSQCAEAALKQSVANQKLAIKPATLSENYSFALAQLNLNICLEDEYVAEMMDKVFLGWAEKARQLIGLLYAPLYGPCVDSVFAH